VWCLSWRPWHVSTGGFATGGRWSQLAIRPLVGWTALCLIPIMYNKIKHDSFQVIKVVSSAGNWTQHLTDYGHSPLRSYSDTACYVNHCSTAVSQTHKHGDEVIFLQIMNLVNLVYLWQYHKLLCNVTQHNCQNVAMRNYEYVCSK